MLFCVYLHRTFLRMIKHEANPREEQRNLDAVINELLLNSQPH